MIDRIKVLILYAIFACSGLIQAQAPLILNKNSWQELEVEKLVRSINRTRTNEGLMALAYLLYPLEDAEQILNRQSIIKGLMEDSILFEATDTFFGYLVDKKLLENTLHSKDLNSAENLDVTIPFPYYPKISWKEKKGLLPHVGIDRINPAQHSAFALDCAFLKSEFFSIYTVLSLFGLSSLVSYFQAAGIAQKQGVEIDVLRGMNNELLRGMTLPIRPLLPVNLEVDPQELAQAGENHPAIFSTFLRTASNGATFKDMYDTISAYFGSLSDAYSPVKIPRLVTQGAGIPFAGAASLISLALYQEKVSSATPRILAVFRILNGMRARMRQIKMLFSCINELGLVLDTTYNDAIKNEFAPIIAFAREKSSAQKELETILKKGTFIGEKSYFYRRGNVMRAAYLLDSLLKDLVPVFESIFKLDAYFSLAHMMRESQTKNAQFCFAEIVPGPEIQFSCIDGWLPTLLSNKSLDQNSIITNSFDLVINGQSKMVISGPNGTGKSMVLKMIGNGIILAQSVGIFPAKSARTSLFSVIKTSISPEEDNSQGLSRFGSELLTLEEMRKDLLSEFAHKPTLIIIDEPCRGTHPEETARRFCQFCKDIAQKKNIFLLCASHSAEVPALATAFPDVYKNYQLLVQEPLFGQFNRTYKLVSGSADWWFHDQPKRSRYVDWFIEKVVKPKLANSENS